MSSEMDGLLLEMQRALLNAVSPFLRAVRVFIKPKEKKQIFDFFYDGNISDELFDLASIASTEGSCSLDFLCEEHIVQLNYPEPIPPEGIFVYHRYEPVCSPFKKLSSFEVKNPEAKLLLYTQQALLGKIVSNLREVSVDLNSQNMKLELTFIYDRDISPLAEELTHKACEELKTVYKEYRLEKIVQRIDSPQRITIRGKRIAFARYELNSSD